MKNYKLNLKKSPVDERDFVAETILSAEGDLPPVWDMRKDLQPIRDQGFYGTCAAQTAACMKEWQEKIDYGNNEHMSPQFVYNHRENQDSEGMYSRDVMKILNKKGICKEVEYPYESEYAVPQKILDSAINNKISGYASIQSVDGLKKALVKNGPCYFAVPVYNFGEHIWYPNQGDEMQGGHAMTCVGYNKKGFIIRNSWGDEWQDSGYTIFPYEHWGMHWEVWTAIDEKSSEPLPTMSFWEKLINWIMSLFK